MAFYLVARGHLSTQWRARVDYTRVDGGKAGKPSALVSPDKAYKRELLRGLHQVTNGGIQEERRQNEAVSSTTFEQLSARNWSTANYAMWRGAKIKGSVNKSRDRKRAG